MVHFNCVFGDAPSGGYGIYVVLHVTYRWTYVEATQDDGLLFSRGAPSEAMLGEVVELTGEGNVRRPQYHSMAYLGQHQCRVILFSCFNYIYMYYCFLNIKRTQKNTGGL